MEGQALFRATFRGLDPTGREIAVDHAFFFRFADGKGAEIWEIRDQEQLNRRLADRADVVPPQTLSNTTACQPRLWSLCAT